MKLKAIKGIQVVRGDDGKYGLEVWGEHIEYLSAVNWDEPFGDMDTEEVSTPFIERVLEPTFDSIEDLGRDVDYERREYHYRVGSRGKVGMLAVNVTRPRYADQVSSHTVLPMAYDMLVKVGAPPPVALYGAPSAPAQIKSLIFVRGPKFEVFDYPRYASEREATQVCASGSWDDLVRRLRKKMPGVTDKSLGQAYEGLMGGPPGADWYRDPLDRHEYRYWDGSAWTAHVSDSGKASQDPLDVTAPSDQGDAASKERPSGQPERLGSNLGNVDESARDTVEVPNPWGLEDGEPFALPLRPAMSEVFAQTQKAERYKIFFSYLYHPDPAVRLATLVEGKKLNIYLGENQAVVDKLADSSPEVRVAAAQLMWDSPTAIEFALRCLGDEINRTGWTSTMTPQQGLAALELLRQTAPAAAGDTFEEAIAEIVGSEYRK
jgi:hypothetical protein